MSLPKQRENLKIAILLSCYLRPEYTQKCIESLRRCEKPCEVFFYQVDDGSVDRTVDVLTNSGLPGVVVVHPDSEGLRNRCIDFFKYANDRDFDFIGKIDNDCVVPENWITGMLDVFERSDVGILSPNVEPSNAAYTHGTEDLDAKGYRPGEVVGGLWFMRANLIKDVHFERHDTAGLLGATTLLRQILTEKEPKIGWVTDVTVQDIGHWSGKHPDHIKTEEHFAYSKEVGRPVAWKAQ